MKTTLQTIVIMIAFLLLLGGVIEIGDLYPKAFALITIVGCSILVLIMGFVSIKSMLDDREQRRKRRASPNDRD